MRAGLVSRDELSQAAPSEPLPGGRLAEALWRAGVPEEKLTRFFLAAGFGPILGDDDFDEVVPSALKRVPRELAHRLRAIPIKFNAAGLVVAMADPSDEQAVEEIGRSADIDIFPVAARISSLMRALQSLYPETNPASEPPIELRKRTRRGESGNQTNGAEFALPLVRRKPRALDYRAEGSASNDRPKEPPKQGGGASAWALYDQQKTKPVQIQWPDSIPKTSDIPTNTIKKLATEASTKARPQKQPKRRKRPKTAAASDFDPDTPVATRVERVLQSIERERDRDAVVKLACEGAVTVGRCGVLFAVRKGFVRGWESRGPTALRDAIRNLWVPTDRRSVVQAPARDQKPHIGPFGDGAVDQLLQAAMGNRGGAVAAYPVLVNGKTVSVLCGSDIRHQDDGPTHIESIATALGNALERFIVAGKA